MQWWACEPIVFAREGELESNRIRLMLAEKSATCAVRVMAPEEPTPDYLTQLNPDGAYPFLVCKDLACHGHALEELLHERYHSVPLLAEEPIPRAQMRFVSDTVRSWYTLTAREIRGHFNELIAAFDPHRTFYVSQTISLVDIAIAPLLFDRDRIQYRLPPGHPFTGYARMMLARPAFRILARPSLVAKLA